MLSFKRLLSIVLIVAVLGGLFLIMYRNMNEVWIAGALKKSSDAPEREFTGTRELDGGDKPRVFMLGNLGDAQYGKIYENVRRFCQDIHLQVSGGERLDASRAAENDLVIFCDADISRYADSVELKKFIAGGGKAIFAAGLSEGKEDYDLWNALGIREKDENRDFKDLVFEKPFLPVQPDRLAYGGSGVFTWIKVSDDADVYVKDEKTDVPILYTYEYQEGVISLINGTFLDDARCMGFLSGAFGALFDDFIYPVLGVKTVFLDDFPMASSVDNELCMEIYGYSEEGFVKDVILPFFCGMSLRSQTPYTLEASEAEVDDELFAAACTSVQQFGGELVFDGDERLSWAGDCVLRSHADVGNSMQDGNLFKAYSCLGAYGMVSHVFDVGALIGKDGNGTSWDSGKEEIGIFESDVLGKASWLEGKTLPQAEDDVKSYQGMDYGWVRNGNRVELDCSGIVKGQAFFYHTKARVASAEGLSFQDVGNGYYLLRVHENSGVIVLEEEK